MIRVLPILWLSGCFGVRSASDAPFVMGPVKSALWAEADSNDDLYTRALLVLSNEPVSCRVLDGESLEDAYDDFTEDGHGLVIALTQVAFDPDRSVPDWEGLYTDTGGSLQDPDGRVVRSMDLAAFEEGYLFETRSEDEVAWLRLDEVGGSDIKGNFSSPWWWGPIRAESCGEWDEPNGDTG